MTSALCTSRSNGVMKRSTTHSWETTPIQLIIDGCEMLAINRPQFSTSSAWRHSAIRWCSLPMGDLNALAAQFSAKLIDADVGFFYYSGHGFQTNQVDQAYPINHIVPMDFELERADAALDTLPLDSIIQPL